jgi:hypothetical protein
MSTQKSLFPYPNFFKQYCKLILHQNNTNDTLLKALHEKYTLLNVIIKKLNPENYLPKSVKTTYNNKLNNAVIPKNPLNDKSLLNYFLSEAFNNEVISIDKELTDLHELSNELGEQMKEVTNIINAKPLDASNFKELQNELNIFFNDENSIQNISKYKETLSEIIKKSKELCQNYKLFKDHPLQNTFIEKYNTLARYLTACSSKHMIEKNIAPLLKINYTKEYIEALPEELKKLDTTIFSSISIITIVQKINDAEYLNRKWRRKNNKLLSENIYKQFFTQNCSTEVYYNFNEKNLENYLKKLNKNNDALMNSNNIMIGINNALRAYFNTIHEIPKILEKINKMLIFKTCIQSDPVFKSLEEESNKLLKYQLPFFGYDKKLDPYTDKINQLNEQAKKFSTYLTDNTTIYQESNKIKICEQNYITFLKTLISKYPASKLPLFITTEETNNEVDKKLPILFKNKHNDTQEALLEKIKALQQENENFHQEKITNINKELAELDRSIQVYNNILTLTTKDQSFCQTFSPDEIEKIKKAYKGEVENKYYESFFSSFPPEYNKTTKTLQLLQKEHNDFINKIYAIKEYKTEIHNVLEKIKNLSTTAEEENQKLIYKNDSFFYDDFLNNTNKLKNTLYNLNNDSLYSLPDRNIFNNLQHPDRNAIRKLSNDVGKYYTKYNTEKKLYLLKRLKDLKTNLNELLEKATDIQKSIYHTDIEEYEKDIKNTEDDNNASKLIDNICNLEKKIKNLKEKLLQ